MLAPVRQQPGAAPWSFVAVIKQPPLLGISGNYSPRSVLVVTEEGRDLLRRIGDGHPDVSGPRSPATRSVQIAAPVGQRLPQPVA